MAITLAQPYLPVAGDIAGIGRRFAALASVLDDVPAQAWRFARWRAARDTIIAQTETPTTPRKLRGLQHRRRRIWPLRPGRPPGWRRKPEHEVHEILNNTHGLALDVLERRDTS